MCGGNRSKKKEGGEKDVFEENACGKLRNVEAEEGLGRVEQAFRRDRVEKLWRKRAVPRRSKMKLRKNSYPQ